MDFQTFVKKHYFWILFGVAILLVPVGWWLGTNSLAAKTEARITDIKSAEQGIPNPSDHPNEGWTKNLGVVNKAREQHHYEQSVRLWNLQRGIMQWPAAVANVMHDAEFFKDGKADNVQDANRARTAYAEIYPQHARTIYEIVRPIQWNGTTGKYEGLVKFDFPERGQNNAAAAGGTPGVGGIGAAAPMGPMGGGEGGGVAGGQGVMGGAGMFPRVPDSLWSNRSPTFREMWKAELDLWLLAALLKSIDRVNVKRGAKTIHDASIREIAHLTLHGGTRTTDEEGSGEGEGTGGEGSPDGAGTKPGYGPTPDGGGVPGAGGLTAKGGGDGTGAAAGGAAGAGDIPTPPPVDLFGAEQSDEATGGENGGEGGEGGEGGSSPDGAPGAPGGGYPGPKGGGVPGTGQGGNAQALTMSPWVDNNPEMPFKTRGFILKVLIKRTDIPLLIQELTDANKTKFPVEILWINSVDRDVDHAGSNVLLRYGGGSSTQGFAGAGGPMSPDGAGSRGVPRGYPGPGVGGKGGAPMRGESGPGAGTRGVPMSGGTGTGASILPYQSALEDPALGYVVVAGLMTVYQRPKKPEATEESSNNPDNTTPPETTSDPKVNNTPPAKTDGKTPAKTGEKTNNPTPAVGPTPTPGTKTGGKVKTPAGTDGFRRPMNNPTPSKSDKKQPAAKPTPPAVKSKPAVKQSVPQKKN